MREIKIGYFFWGHLGDKLTEQTRDTPDGNATYSSCIIDYLCNSYEKKIKAFNFYFMSLDRDREDYRLVTRTKANSRSYFLFTLL